MAAGDLLASFSAKDALIPTGSVSAALTTLAGSSIPAEVIPVIAFDDGTEEYIDFVGVMPPNYEAGADITVRVRWGAAEAAPDVVEWEVSIRRVADDAEDLNSTAHDYLESKAVFTAPSAAGETVSSFFTLWAGYLDSIAAGEMFILRISRDESPSSGTDVTGDAYIHSVEMYQAGALLLDGVSDLGPVHSLRRLLSAYQGPCVRISRSSDGTQSDFYWVNNKVDAVGIQEFCGGSNARIPTWYDQTDAVDMTQGAESRMPLFIQSSMINGMPAIRFTEADDWYLEAGSIAVSNFVTSNTYTGMCVMAQDGDDNENCIWAFGNSNLDVHFTYQDYLYSEFGTSGNTGRVFGPQPAGWDDAGNVVEWYKAANNDMEILVNGRSIIKENKTGTGNVSGFTASTVTIARRPDAQVKATFDLSELIFIKADAGATTRELIRSRGVGIGAAQSMAHYHGITTREPMDLHALFSDDLVAWYDASQQVFSDAGSTTATNGQDVAQWNDLSGNGYHISESTNKPVWTAAGFNSDYPGVVFTAANSDKLVSAAAVDLAGTTEISVWVVGQMSSSTNDYGRIVNVVQGTEGDYSHATGFAITRYQSNQAIGVAGLGSYDVSTKALTYNTPCVMGGSQKTNEQITYVDNVAGATDTTTDTYVPVDNATLRLGVYPGGATNFFDGTLSEVVLLKTIPTAAQRAALHEYFTQKWGL